MDQVVIAIVLMRSHPTQCQIEQGKVASNDGNRQPDHSQNLKSTQARRSNVQEQDDSSQTSEATTGLGAHNGPDDGTILSVAANG